LARKQSKQSGSDSDEPTFSRTLPLNKLVSHRDKDLRKARDLFNEGKTDEARNAFERAEYWQAKIDSPG
jgi:hypothetical protein